MHILKRVLQIIVFANSFSTWSKNIGAGRSFAMDFGLSNSLMLIEDESFFDCFNFEEPLATIPPLHYCDQVADDALVPLPYSFNCNFDHLSDLSASSQFLVPDQYYHHDFRLDDFCWDNINHSTHIDAMPLNIVDSMVPTLLDGDVLNFGSGNAMEVMNVNIGESIERRTVGRSKLAEIGLDEMKSYFYMPITRAAKEMNVGVTLLKKRCRELGIPRWPHRKMKSLKTLIHNVQELGKGLNEECIRRELESLDEHRRLMEENPDLQLTERTKKLRQACFKANYKRRRAMQVQGPYFNQCTSSPC